MFRRNVSGDSIACALRGLVLGSVMISPNFKSMHRMVFCCFAFSSTGYRRIDGQVI
jgi:hypothetical protein